MIFDAEILRFEIAYFFNLAHALTLPKNNDRKIVVRDFVNVVQDA
jgi:hypothetical protein